MLFLIFQDTIALVLRHNFLMMTYSPKCCLALLAILFSFQAFAQKAIIKQGTNGKLSYSYCKLTANNNFELQITYKNEPVIYKEQLDSVVLRNQQEVAEFTTALEKTIASLNDAKASVYIEKPTYSLFKFEKGILGTFVSISNPSGTVVANNNKEQALTFLNWLQRIEFGKE
ncbi:MAG: hypothetical protein RLZ95_2 [Bacteroidota bacterium]